MSDPIKFLENHVEIPSLPIIYTKISEMLNNPRSSISDIGKIISTDSGLTVRLLRLANSAFYGFSSEINTIDRALIVIGTKELHDLVLATTVLSMFKSMSSKSINMEAYWRHNIACGVAAKTIAVFRRDVKIEQFFVAGILHDIGRLLLLSNIPDRIDLALQRSESKNKLLYEVERQVIGFDHGQLGKTLLSRWNIPANLIDMVGYHHQPQNSDNFSVETSIIHIADIIVHALELGDNGEKFVPQLNEQAWENVGLSVNTLLAIIAQINKQYNDVINSMLMV